MIRPIDPGEIPTRSRSKNEREIQEFLDTGSKAGEVDLEGRTLNSAAACYRVAIRRNNYPVKQVARDGRLYLLRTD